MNINKLNRLLDESGISKRKLTQLCGISRPTLDNALSGMDIRISTLESISSVLKVSPAVFFDDTSHKQAIANGASSLAFAANDIKFTSDNSPLAEKVKLLEKLVDEKERTIQILLKKEQ